ncbi:MAG: energy-coupling factor transporter transmembrane component T [Chloroflexota bacterium]
MNLFYTDNNAFLQRLNPLSKVLAMLPVLTFVALTTDPYAPIATIVIAALTILVLGRVPLGRFLKIAAPMALLMVGYLLFYPLIVRQELVAHTPLVFELGPLRVYQGGIRFGLATGLRIYALVLLSLMFTLTSDASDFIRALVQQWRLPYKIGYGALAAFRFVPMLQSELRVIQAAHKVRGISDKGGLRAQLARMRRYTIPLLATAIRQAERTALAMDGRAFGAFEQRTYYRTMTFSRSDTLFIILFWLVCFAAIYLLDYFGLLGSLVFLQMQ